MSAAEKHRSTTPQELVCSPALTNAKKPQLSGLITQCWNVFRRLNAALPFLLSPGQQSPNID